ncbi:MAG: MBL fold metallo-hydrolase [Methanomicrobiaceae archaeon]|uniref:Metallo-beta-lactamase family protein n=1 Tax=hydrocarbon metagenome TaxID=938273 RepID=A0A0W8FHR7_9ZZZZ|nr:MBL fold metallo-hydrolase [Methanomicrobiaceae archaeon]MDD5418533.1 MBL fold metallo-hydrolase [Methanomicrobiaceae archaeon]
MLFEKIRSEILAHNSYMIGSDGEAAVIDPRRDCLIYAAIAKRQNMKITHIFETHKNEDYVIGSLELSRPTGAAIYHGAREKFRFGNDAREGDTFRIGTLELSVLETPGHTIESITIVLKDRSTSDDPLMAFTGDALFAGDVGRTDLAGEDTREMMSALLYDSIHEKILPLGDDVVLCPAHGAGSVCGGAISDREYTTIGYERRNTPLLGMEKEAFVEAKVNEKLSEPFYFQKMRELNRGGPPLIHNLPHLAALTPEELDAQQEKAQIVDIRSPTGFAGGHVPGSINIWRQGLPVYMGYILNYEDPILLIDDFNLDLDTAIRHFVRLGYDNLTGYLAGGFPAWSKSGRRIGTSGTWSIHDLREHQEDASLFILDVRKITEWEKPGHLEGAHHIYVGDLEAEIGKVPKDRHVAVHCDVGFKGSIAASILKKHGYPEVTNVLGGSRAWQAAGYPMVKE